MPTRLYVSNQRTRITKYRTTVHIPGRTASSCQLNAAVQPRTRERPFTPNSSARDPKRFSNFGFGHSSKKPHLDDVSCASGQFVEIRSKQHSTGAQHRLLTAMRLYSRRELSAYSPRPFLGTREPRACSTSTSRIARPESRKKCVRVMGSCSDL